VLGEAMKPFLEYGWQPQAMAVDGRTKAIDAGRIEVYDVVADPREARNLAGGGAVPASLRKALDDYPAPSPAAARAPDNLSEEARRQLASLGYVSASAPPVVRKDAPRPVDMVHLFDDLDRASGLFVQGKYAEVVPLLQRILSEDRFNLDATLRLATAQSMLGRDGQARASFQKAAEMAPQSPDVRMYLALHYARGKEWERAIPALEQVVADTPDRLAAVEALATIRERQGRPEDALTLWHKVHALRPATPAELVKVGELAMGLGQTTAAIAAFEAARQQRASAFRHDLELGLLYLDARRFEDARAALDRVPSTHPDYPMALFKRAQVSVLLKEPDSAAKIAHAKRRATPETHELIANERLFRE
jgi:tetratricopeptide (TPR) repeat protein